MTEWPLYLAPLAVAGILLLFRFVGCALDRSGALSGDPIPPPADYGALILAEPDLVGYWRLGEPVGTGAGDAAVDEKGTNPGTYQTADLSAAPNSPETDHPPTLDPGQAGLIESAPAQTSVLVNGGYVRIPHSTTLNPPKIPGFSVEAWVRAEWDESETGVFRCVVASREDTGGAKHGYILYAGPQLDPVTFAVVDPDMRWQAWVGDGTTWRMLRRPKDEFRLNLPTYLLMTYDGATETLSFDAVHWDVDLDTYAAVTMAADYSPSPAAATRPLYIGMGAPEVATPRYPFHGRIQEVAIYSNVLPGARFTAHLQAAAGI